MDQESEGALSHLRASEEAINFLASIEPQELSRCLFGDELMTMSRDGTHLGEFRMRVYSAPYREHPDSGGGTRFLVHATSKGAINDIPCGTTVCAYVTTNLATLEQHHHEYLELNEQALDRKVELVWQEESLLVNKVVTEGEEVLRESVRLEMSHLAGFLSEASCLLLTRLLTRRAHVPHDLTFLCLDSESCLATCTFRSLGTEELSVGEEKVEVFGIERTLYSQTAPPTTWHSYYLRDGHLVRREQVGSPTTMMIVRLPVQTPAAEEAEEKEEGGTDSGVEQQTLNWEEDMQMYSHFLDRKEELLSEHAEYARAHPELRALLGDFLQYLLLRKPADPVACAAPYFASFSALERDIPSTRSPPTPQFTTDATAAASPGDGVA
ncbi:ciliogenesis-associated TTC17-interacting protein isoform X1 [Lethenteron reissneri]|uniref:ciliogenesis-associated TTC17-interacting protein isoform X1 n=2 Tax=Lethenteron reissneri TaxID=7753 RepID=UPI002AB6F95E|nr:ciliogenesis-associated TTC17-interacting protein isoform X1 [Lethenteron reissneri]